MKDQNAKILGCKQVGSRALINVQVHHQRYVPMDARMMPCLAYAPFSVAFLEQLLIAANLRWVYVHVPTYLILIYLIVLNDKQNILISNWIFRTRNQKPRCECNA